MVEKLLQYGADVKVTNGLGLSPLEMCALLDPYEGRNFMFSLLIGTGANVTPQTLHLAAR